MKEKFTITIDGETLQRFRDLCQSHGMKLSTRIELLLEQDIVKLQTLTNTKGE